MTRGWKNEPTRHGLASQGVKTTNKTENNQLTLGDITDDFNLRKLYHLTATGLATKDDLSISSEMTDVINQLNTEADYEKEWIADLDYGKPYIYINDSVISDKTDESELDWRETITNEEKERGEETDPNNCIGYIHYHPKGVDKRPTAQDFILALNIDEMRNEDNKDRFRPTTFGVVRDDSLRFFFLTPSDEQRKELRKKLQNIQMDSKEKYFERLKKVINNMKDKDILHETKDIKIDGER